MILIIVAETICNGLYILGIVHQHLTGSLHLLSEVGVPPAGSEISYVTKKNQGKLLIHFGEVFLKE